MLNNVLGFTRLCFVLMPFMLCNKMRASDTEISFANLTVLLLKDRLVGGEIVGLVRQSDIPSKLTLNKDLISDLKSDYRSKSYLEAREKTLQQINAKLGNSKSGVFLVFGETANAVLKLETSPIPKGKYTAFQVLEASVAGEKSIALFGFGGGELSGNCELDQVMEKQNFLELIFILTKRLGGNYWSIGFSGKKDDEKSADGNMPMILSPQILKVLPP